MNPSSGRFLTQDSFEGVTHDPATLHKYLYAGADPVNKVDPSGHFFGLADIGAANSIRSTLANIQINIGFAIVDQIVYGGDAGIKSLITGGVVTLGAVFAARVARGFIGLAGNLADDVGRAVTSGGRKIYRGLSELDNPATGLYARAPGAGNSPASHVAGKRATQWISATKDLNVAVSKYGKNGVVEIDLDKVPSEIVDISDGIPGIGGMLSNWARKDKEVLIRDFIPAEAIKVIF
jgi:hypothetical protein